MWIFADFPLVIYYSTSKIVSPGKKTDNKREVFEVTNARRQKSESIHCEWFYTKILYRTQLLNSKGFKPVFEHRNI